MVGPLIEADKPTFDHVYERVLVQLDKRLTDTGSLIPQDTTHACFPSAPPTSPEAAAALNQTISDLRSDLVTHPELFEEKPPAGFITGITHFLDDLL